MSAVELVGFLLLSGAAAFLQTLTGFAFGLIVMGGVGLTGLLSLPDAAVLVSVLTFVNATQMLMKGWRDVAWREVAIVMASSLPMLFVGYWVLEWLAGSQTDLLRLILGAVIIVSSLQLARKPEPRPDRSGGGSFLFFGGISGLMGGMFSTAGPPLVYLFYRQPMLLAQVRETLVAIFALNAGVRVALVTLAGNLPSMSNLGGLMAVPVVIAVTYLTRRWPPPLSPRTMRYVALFLLFLSGASLSAPAAFRFLESYW